MTLGSFIEQLLSPIPIAILCCIFSILCAFMTPKLKSHFAALIIACVCTAFLAGYDIYYQYHIGTLWELGVLFIWVYSFLISWGSMVGFGYIKKLIM